jgi:nicotinamidase-related amidase
VPEGQNELLSSRLRVPASATTLDVRHPNLLHEHHDVFPQGGHVVLCGCWTESCVVGTARAALDADHDVTVVADACTGHEPNASFSMLTIQLAYGSVVRSGAEQQGYT